MPQADVAVPGLLAGVRVLDFTLAVLGPYATRFLAQFGADVVKVESPSGDIIRHTGPGRHPGMAPMFLNLNHGKRSIVLDLKEPSSRPVLDRLLAWADVVVHNTRPSTAARMGIDYDSVKAINPTAVYCAAMGYGSDGPYAEQRALDDVIQAASGATAAQAAPGGPPQYVASALADKTVGLVACQAILAALVHKQRTGKGCELQIPMLETMVEYVLVEHMNGLTYDPPTGPSLYPRAASVHRRPFQTSDGYLSAVVYTDRDWHRLLHATGHADWLTDPRLATLSLRTQHTDHVYGLLGTLFLEHTTTHWLTLLRTLDIPVGPLNTIDDLLTDPHITAVEMIHIRTHPTEGDLRVTRSGITVDHQQIWTNQLAPTLGQHTDTILNEHGFTPAEITTLHNTGALGTTTKVDR